MLGAAVRIEGWSLWRDPYHPPEAGARLTGRAYGHPDGPDGWTVLSSAIVSADPETRTVITESGRVYVLGEIDPEYRVFCAELGTDDPFPRIIKREPSP